MKVGAAILAAGSGTRFGSDKMLATLGGVPLWQWSVKAFRSCPKIDAIVVVAGEALLLDHPVADHPVADHLVADHFGDGTAVIPGGATRAESSAIGVRHLAEAGCDVILIHDGARPFVTTAVIENVIQGIVGSGAAAAAVPAVDTVRLREGTSTVGLDRSKLVAMQTPQGATADIFLKALSQSPEGTQTDEMGLLEAAGQTWAVAEGSRLNFKITSPEDMILARGMLERQTAVGLGYDIHRFSDDPSRPMYLGGVRFEEGPGLLGHSDADVVLHAAADALLGAAVLGDIGVHFPPGDPQWKDVRSTLLLERVATLVRDEGWRIEGLDIAVQAERPKIMPHAQEIRKAIAGCLGIDISRMSIKATTNEGLGSIGRGEGIASFAVASLSRYVLPVA